LLNENNLDKYEMNPDNPLIRYVFEVFDDRCCVRKAFFYQDNGLEYLGKIIYLTRPTTIYRSRKGKLITITRHDMLEELYCIAKIKLGLKMYNSDIEGDYADEFRSILCEHSYEDFKTTN
jgi:hypothetical protein